MALFGLARSADLLPTVRGDGLYLRPAIAADYPAWARLREQSRAFLTPWEPTWLSDDLTRAAFRRRLRRQAEDIAADESFAFLIFDSTSDELLGGLTLGGIRRGVAQAATLGYWMGEPYAGRGYMSRAVRAVLTYAFEKQGLHRIEAACLPNNAPSKRLLERVGFQQEGYARAYLSINGQWRDHLLFALLDTDPQPLRAPTPR